jgi:hypothetical protein
VAGDDERLYLGEGNPGGEGVRGVRALRASNGAALALPDAAAAYAGAVRFLGRRLLVSEEGPRAAVRLRLYDLPTGRDVWDRVFPAGSVLLRSTGDAWVGVAAPDGVVTVLDPSTGREGSRLALDPKHLARVTGGHLLADTDQFYVAFQGAVDEKLQNGPDPWFRGGLAVALFHGMLYAFDRAGGGPRWFSPSPQPRPVPQAILTERFDELPVLVSSAAFTRQADGKAVGVVVTRSLDKKTGKLLFDHENAPGSQPFEALRLDPRTGTIDLVSPTFVLRHRPRKRG